MNLAELRDEVEITLQDTSFGDRIDNWINDAVDLIVDDADLPGFKTIVTVDTVVDQAYTSLPLNCNGRILYVGDSKNELSGGVVTLEALMEMYPSMSETGDVEYVAVEGSTLYYQPIPSTATTLTLLHRRSPVRMTEDTHTPEGIPEHLQRATIVSKAAAIGFSLIEDGVEGEKVNTKAQEINYKMALFDLKNWVAKRVPHRSRSIWSY